MLYLFVFLYFNTSWYPLLYFIFLQKLYASAIMIVCVKYSLAQTTFKSCFIKSSLNYILSSDMVFVSFSKILCDNLTLLNGIDHIYFDKMEFAKLIIHHSLGNTSLESTRKALD